MSAPIHRLAVFRADAAPEIGVGHVVRCLTLAFALKKQEWRVALVTVESTVAAIPSDPLNGIDIFITDQIDDASVMMSHWPHGCDLLVLDHYDLDAGYERACRPWANRILVLEDLVGRNHDCDVLLDPTLGRAPSDYDTTTPAHTGILTGPKYALVRSSFYSIHHNQACHRTNTSLQRVVVSLGATDPDNATCIVLQGLKDLGLGVDVVLGASAPHLDAVRAAAARLTPTAELHIGLDSENMARLYERADLCIGAGGSSAWERCAMGLPSLLVRTADNQNDIIAALVRQGISQFISDSANLIPEAVADAVGQLVVAPHNLAAMGGASIKTCDGHGAVRVSTMLSGLSGEVGITNLRPLALADEEMLLDWQGEDGSREYAHNRDKPTPEEHATWFKRYREDPDGLIFIIEHERVPVGVLRLDREKRDGMLSVSILLAAAHRARGIGTAALHLIHDMWPNSIFCADILAENTASLRLFHRVGYRPSDGTYIRLP